MTVAPRDVVLSRRRFLARGLCGMTVLGLGGCATSWAHAAAARGGGAADVHPGIRVDVHSHLFNGHDLELARFLEAVVAPAHGAYGDLIRAGADIAQALAWALAPSGAAEAWRLDELARRRGPELSTSDDAEIVRDREEAEARFREAIRVVLPRTEFFRLYLDRLRPGTRATLGRPAETRLARMADAAILSRDETDFLLSPEGPERAVLAVRPLDAFRRYTYHRYLSVHELFHARAAEEAGVDLVIPSPAPLDDRLAGRRAPTSPRDQVLAMARMVTLCGGRMHPLVSFETGGWTDAEEALGLVRDALEHRGFLGVTLSRACDARALGALLAWCEREEVPVVVPDVAWTRLSASYPGLRLGVRAEARRERPGDDATLPGLMYGLDWLGRAIEGDAIHVLRASGGRLSPAVAGENAASFFGLRQGRRARRRLERFYDRHRVATPRWMAALDEAGPC